MTKAYKAVQHAPGKARLPQKSRKMKETPYLKPFEYEKPKKGTRS